MWNFNKDLVKLRDFFNFSNANKKKNHKIRINRSQNCFIRILSLFCFCLFFPNRKKQKNVLRSFDLKFTKFRSDSIFGHRSTDCSQQSIFHLEHHWERSLNNFSRTHNKMMSTLNHVSRPTVNFRKLLPLMLRMLHNVQWKKDAERSNPSPIFRSLIRSYGWYTQCRTYTITSSSTGSRSGEKHPRFSFPMLTNHQIKIRWLDNEFDFDFLKIIRYIARVQSANGVFGLQYLIEYQLNYLIERRIITKYSNKFIGKRNFHKFKRIHLYGWRRCECATSL